MSIILVDHDIAGQVLILWGALAAGGWLEICPLQLVTFVHTIKNKSVPNGIKLSSNAPFINELRSSRCNRAAASGIGSAFNGAGVDMGRSQW